MDMDWLCERRLIVFHTTQKGRFPFGAHMKWMFLITAWIDRMLLLTFPVLLFIYLGVSFGHPREQIGQISAARVGSRTAPPSGRRYLLLEDL
jgi:hypothetical protein